MVTLIDPDVIEITICLKFNGRSISYQEHMNLSIDLLNIKGVKWVDGFNHIVTSEGLSKWFESKELNIVSYRIDEWYRVEKDDKKIGVPKAMTLDIHSEISRTIFLRIR